MRKLVSLFALLLVAFLSVSANAAHITVLSASLDSAQAGTDSEGKGAATMTYNSNTGEFLWFVAWQGLSAAPTAAHFHGPAGPGMSAGVEVPIDSTSNPSIGSAVLSAQQTSDLLSGLWYINIHTALFPGGEIRGQVFAISQVPVPAAVWLMMSALGGLGFLRRRI